MTADEFLLRPDPADGTRQELVRGEVLAIPLRSHQHGGTIARLSALVGAYIQEHRLGTATTCSGLITVRDPDAVREPDLAFWSFARLPPGVLVSGYSAIPPDLCIEIVSIGNPAVVVQEKVREYLDCGVRVVWVIELRQRTVAVHRAGSVSQLSDDAIITGEDVIPGFECRIADFFPPLPAVPPPPPPSV
jgi:Uma2 family endonuclease